MNRASSVNRPGTKKSPARGGSSLLLLAALAALALLASCRSPQRKEISPPLAVAAHPSPARPSPPPGPAAAPANPVSDLARREILRRQERVRRMDAAALEANRALAENDLEGAVGGFRQASSGLP